MERRVFALTLAMGASGSWNLDMSRHARESLPPARYLSSSYYEIWLAALEDLMRERGLVSARELDTGTSDTTPATLKSVLKAEDVAARLAAGGPVAREPSEPARFRVGDRVTARKLNPTGHIRLPRYARGIEGRIARVHGCHILPDAHCPWSRRSAGMALQMSPSKRAISGARRAARGRCMSTCGRAILTRPEPPRAPTLPIGPDDEPAFSAPWQAQGLRHDGAAA